MGLKSFNKNGVWGTNATNENLCLTFLVSQSSAHETQTPGFHPAKELQHFIFMKLRPLVFILCKHFIISFSWSSGPRFSSCARMSPFNFHEPQSRVFSPCMHFTGYFSWISGPGCQPLWAISTFIFSYPLTPRTSSLSTASFTRTALQVTLGISANLSWTHSQTQNLRPRDFISHKPRSQEKHHKTPDP